MEYKDFTFNRDSYNKLEAVSESNAIVLAVRNIILSRPGNFTMSPGVGLDLRKYQFEFLDEVTIDSLSKELSSQIISELPTISGLGVNIEKVNIEGITNRDFLGISISATVNDETIESRHLVYQSENGDLEMLNETY